MLNLFITSSCDLGCDYCFVAKDFAGAPGDLSKSRFLELLPWLAETRAPSLALLGGEPTLHPELFYFLSQLLEEGVAPVLFTNALFPSFMAENLANLTYRIVVNYNGPKNYRPEDYQRRERNLRLLIDSGATVTFSKNFAPLHMDYDYLIKAATDYGIKYIRYDLSRPRADFKNAYFERESLRSAAKTIFAFAGEAKAAGIGTGLDCCLPRCLFEPEKLSILQKNSDPFSGVCRPSLDILPDLSAIHCWPLKRLSVESALAFDGELGLLEHFANLALELRAKARGGCQGCLIPPSSCQGGCLAQIIDGS
jgi:organic radical activating enzyme